MGEDEERGGGRAVEESSVHSFFVDNNPGLYTTQFSYCKPDTDGILGDNDDDTAQYGSEARLCFNCGSPDHTVSACPSPPNFELISLSRQLFNFIQSQHGNHTGVLERIHVVEAQKQQRLQWLDMFVPGEVRGSLLRDALGLEDGQNDGEWLRNMAIWGYPKGWVGEEDPRESVRRRIEEECDAVDEVDELTFTIFGEVDEEGLDTTQLFSLPTEYPKTMENGVSGDEDSSDTATSSSSSPPTSTLCRWATYSSTHFLSSLLPIYTGFALPPLISNPHSTTFDNDRRALWDRITSVQYPDPISSLQPPPPPPLTEPPPLPPAMPASPPPGPLPPLPGHIMLPRAPLEDLDQELDMDISDSDEDS